MGQRQGRKKPLASIAGDAVSHAEPGIEPNELDGQEVRRHELDTKADKIELPEKT